MHRMRGRRHRHLHLPPFFTPPSTNQVRSSSSSLVRDGKDGKSSQGVFMSRGGAHSRKNNNNHGDESNDDDDGLILMLMILAMAFKFCIDGGGMVLLLL